MASTSASNDEERVLVLPGLEVGQAASLRAFSLPDPRSGRPQGFILANRTLLEVNRFKQAHSAWLLPGKLLADGGMFISTPYDPLYVLLPLLDRARDKDESCPAGKFKELDELLYDSANPALAELLPYARAPYGTAAACDAATAAVQGGPVAAVDATMAVEAGSAPAEGGEAGARPQPAADGGEGVQGAGVQQQHSQQQQQQEHLQQQAACGRLEQLRQQLACLCDVKQVDESAFYRLNDRRVLAWLSCKYKQVAAALAAQVAGMDAQHAVSYVLAFLGEYVPEVWLTALAKHLGHDRSAALAPGTALQPADGNVQPAPRPAPPGGGPPEKKQKVDPQVARQAAKQAAMAKQAAGTKKLTAFFTKKG